MNNDDISITYGSEGSDCTRPYYITLNRKDITVEEFIKWVLKQTREWGYISIGGKNPFKSDYSLEYKYGVAKANGVIPKNILTSVISEVSGSGGWSRSDYQLTIKKSGYKEKFVPDRSIEEQKKDGMKNIVKFANEIKEYCKSRNNCYGCAFFDEEVAYEDGCRLNDRPMFWKEGESGYDYNVQNPCDTCKNVGDCEPCEKMREGEDNE